MTKATNFYVGHLLAAKMFTALAKTALRCYCKHWVRWQRSSWEVSLRYYHPLLLQYSCHCRSESWKSLAFGGTFATVNDG